MDSCIMSSPFFNPQTIDLAFSTEAPGIRSGQLVAFDIYGNVLLRARSSSFSSKHFILDADSDNPLLTLKSKVTLRSQFLALIRFVHIFDLMN